MEKTQNRKIYYGWWIVLAGALLLVSNLSLTINVFSVFLLPLQEKLMLTSAQVGVLPSIQTFTGVFMFALSGTLYSRFSLRFVSTICGCFPAIGYFLYSYASSVTTCYIAAICLGIGYGGSTMVPASLLITNWFQERRVTALAIASIGTGIATIVIPPILSSLIINLGVDSAFNFLAGLIIFFTAISFVIIRDTPESQNMLPYGAILPSTPEDKLSERNPQVEAVDPLEGLIESPLTLKNLSRTWHFRAFMIASLLFGLPLGPLMVRLSPIVQYFGFSPSYGALMVSLCGGALILGKYCYGVCNDRFGSKIANYFIFSVWFSGLLLYFLLHSMPFLTPLFVFLFGFSMAQGTLSLPIWSMDLYGPAHYTKVLAYAKTMYTIGNSVGMLIPGYIVDHFQSYDYAIAFFFLVSVIAFLTIIFLYRYNYPNKI